MPGRVHPGRRGSARGREARAQGADQAPSSPRRARLAIKAPVPKDHASASSQATTSLTSAPELGRGDRHHVAALVGEALPGAPRSSIGANMVPMNSTSPSGYWWCSADRLAGELGQVAADLADRLDPSRRKPSGPSTVSATLGFAHVVEGEALVEQPEERPDRARGVVVLGAAEQQRAAALHVAQVHVVAEGDADDRAVAVDRQHQLRLGVAPDRGRVHADRAPVPPRPSAGTW